MLGLFASLLVIGLGASALATGAGQAPLPEEHDPALASKTMDELLACGTAIPTDGGESQEAFYCGSAPWAIARELGSRGIDNQLLRAFDSASRDKRTVIVYALYRSQLPEVVPFMESIAFRRRPVSRDGDGVAWAKAFLLKRCDPRILREHVRRPSEIAGLPGGSFQYSFLVPYLGRCHYAPAIPYLLTLLEEVSLNVVGSAEEALRAFYPNDESFKTLAEERRYYAARYKAKPRP